MNPISLEKRPAAEDLSDVLSQVAKSDAFSQVVEECSIIIDQDIQNEMHDLAKSFAKDYSNRPTPSSVKDKYLGNIDLQLKRFKTTFREKHPIQVFITGLSGCILLVVFTVFFHVGFLSSITISGIGAAITSLGISKYRKYFSNNFSKIQKNLLIQDVYRLGLINFKQYLTLKETINNRTLFANKLMDALPTLEMTPEEIMGLQSVLQSYRWGDVRKCLSYLCVRSLYRNSTEFQTFCLDVDPQNLKNLAQLSVTSIIQLEEEKQLATRYTLFCYLQTISPEPSETFPEIISALKEGNEIEFKQHLNAFLSNAFQFQVIDATTYYFLQNICQKEDVNRIFELVANTFQRSNAFVEKAKAVSFACEILAYALDDEKSQIYQALRSTDNVVQQNQLLEHIENSLEEQLANEFINPRFFQKHTRRIKQQALALREMYSLNLDRLDEFVFPYRNWEEEGHTPVAILNSMGGGGHRAATTAVRTVFQDDFVTEADAADAICADFCPLQNSLILNAFNTHWRGSEIYNWLLQREQSFLINCLAKFGHTQMRFSEKEIVQHLMEWILAEGARPSGDGIVISNIPFFNGHLITAIEKLNELGIPVRCLLQATDFDTLNYRYIKPKSDCIQIAVAMKHPLLLQRLNKKFGINPEEVLYSGLPLREEFLEERSAEDLAEIREHFSIRKNEKVIMLMMGAVGGASLINWSKALSEASKAATEENPVHIMACCGRSYEQLKDNLSAIETPAHVTITPVGMLQKAPGKRSVADLMAVSDIATGKPGPNYLNECWQMGLPVFVAGSNLVDWEKMNAEIVKADELGMVVSHLKDVGEKLPILIKDIDRYKENVRNFKRKYFDNLLPYQNFLNKFHEGDIKALEDHRREYLKIELSEEIKKRYLSLLQTWDDQKTEVEKEKGTLSSAEYEALTEAYREHPHSPEFNVKTQEMQRLLESSSPSQIDVLQSTFYQSQFQSDIQIFEHYPSFLPLLLRDKKLMANFKKWKREGLDVEVFVKHPKYATWLIKTYLINAMGHFEHQIELDAATGSPQIRIHGRNYSFYEVVKENGDIILPDGTTIALKEYSSGDLVERRWIYLGETGLSSFNFMQWHDISGENPIDFSKESWWKDLPVYKYETHTVDADSVDSIPYGTRAIVQYKNTGTAFNDTHVMAEFLEPKKVEQNEEGRTYTVKYRVYSFGAAPHIIQDYSRGLKTSYGFLGYPDPFYTLHYRSTSEELLWTSEDKFQDAMKVVAEIKSCETRDAKNQVLATEMEEDTEPFLFNSIDRNCTEVAQKLLQAGGFDNLPIEMLFIDTIQNRCVRAVLRCLTNICLTIFPQSFNHGVVNITLMAGGAGKVVYYEGSEKRSRFSNRYAMVAHDRRITQRTLHHVALPYVVKTYLKLRRIQKANAS